MSASPSPTFTSPPPPATVAAATSPIENTIAPALFLIVPLFTLALLVLALSHRPRQGQASGHGYGEKRPQARAAYAFIGVLAVLSTLAGALPLSHTVHPQAEAVVQAFLSLLLGIPVLHLALNPTYAPHKANRLLGILHSSALVITLSGATLLALLSPFLPSSPTGSHSPQYLPSALFLGYSLLALPRIGATLFRFLHPSSTSPNSSSNANLTSASKSSIRFFLPRIRTRSSPTRRPITIHVSTYRTSIPPSLPSPASSAASFPLSDSPNEREHPIELEITLPKRKDSQSNLNEDEDTPPDGYHDRYLYQDEKKHQRQSSSSLLNEKHRKHEKFNSVDSTSTITTVDHARYQSLALPLISLTTPPRAVYTPAFTGDPPFSSTYPQEQLYRFPGTGSDEDAARDNNPNNSDGADNRSLRTQLIHNRSRSLLVFLFAAQLTLLVGYACAVAIDIPSLSLSSSSTSTSGSAIDSLRIVQAACTVLAVTGTMSAYLLHAYNNHLSPSRQRAGAAAQSQSQQPHPLSSMSMAYNPSSAPASTPFSPYAAASTPSSAYPRPSPIQTIAIDTTARTSARPVVIQLAPPPPPKTRRKRVGGFGMGASGLTMPTIPGSGANSNSGLESNENLNLNTGPNTNATSRFSHPNEYEGTSMSYNRIAHDVSYTYPHPSQENHQYLPYPQYPQYQPPQQQQGYCMTREPIMLTYEAPKTAERSLFESTETEGEADLHDLDLDLDLEDEEEQMEDMDGDLDLEDEMQKALSRSSSMVSSLMSGASGRGGIQRTRRRTSVVLRTKSKPTPTTKAKVAAPKPKSKSKSKKALAMEDPATYIRKRGSVPPSAPKRLFGWEFGWDPVPATNRSRAAEREVEELQQESFIDLTGDNEFGVRGGGGRKDNDSRPHKEMKAPGLTAPPRKLKRYSSPAGPVHRSALSREAAKMEKLEDIFGFGTTSVGSVASAVNGNNNIAGGRKLKKRSKSASRPDTADGASVAALPDSQLVFPAHLHLGPTSGSSPPSSAFNMRRSFGLGHRPIKSTSTSGSSGKTSRPGTAESKTSSSFGSGSSMRRAGVGLQLKKSFKMGVGRTLGPGLTLASAGLVQGGAYGHGHRREERAEEEEQETAERDSSSRDSRDGREKSIDVRTMATMDDEDVEGEIRSIAAARLVSASIARITPAATILTAPSTSVTTPPPSAYMTKSQPSPVNASTTYPTPNAGPQSRPTLPAIVTSPIPTLTAKAVPHPMSAPGLPSVHSPMSLKQPHTSGSTWKPHPFADPAEMPASSAATTISQNTVKTEDDVVQLEREMEEIRGMRGDGRDGVLDSPSAPFKELAAFARSAPASPSAPVSAPPISTSMTPSLNSMFALAHAQAQTVAPPPPVPTDKTKAKIFGGGNIQKRMTLSSPPAPSRSDWAPQSSRSAGGGNGGSSTGGFPYKFPMIFPHSFTASGSPPRSSGDMNQQPQSTSTPGTPKGGSTLRLSAMTMDSVRSAFAGVGARMSSATTRMSVNSAAGGLARGAGGAGYGFGEMIMEDGGDGDFMDLRDPFASPPPASKIKTAPVGKKNKKAEDGGGGGGGGGGGVRARDNFLATDSASGQESEGVDVFASRAGAAGARKRMSAWGKLPMPVRSFSPVPSAGSANGSTSGSKKTVNGAAARGVRIVGKAGHRKHKRRSRKSPLPGMSMVGAFGALKAGAEDADFGIEEALLSQRLLSRLDSGSWETRTYDA